MQLTLTYQTEGLNLPVDIVADINTILLEQISEEQARIRLNPYISSVNINANGLDIQEIDILNEECRIGYNTIQVYAHRWIWTVQNKHDCSIKFEYMPVGE